MSSMWNIMLMQVWLWWILVTSMCLLSADMHGRSPEGHWFRLKQWVLHISSTVLEGETSWGSVNPCHNIIIHSTFKEIFCHWSLVLLRRTRIKKGFFICNYLQVNLLQSYSCGCVKKLRRKRKLSSGRRPSLKTITEKSRFSFIINNILIQVTVYFKLQQKGQY